MFVSMQIISAAHGLPTERIMSPANRDDEALGKGPITDRHMHDAGPVARLGYLNRS